MTHPRGALRDLEIDAVTRLVQAAEPPGPVATLMEVGCEIPADAAPHECRCAGLSAAAAALADHGVRTHIVRHAGLAAAMSAAQTADVLVAAYLLGSCAPLERRDAASGLWELVRVGGRLAVLEDLVGPASDRAGVMSANHLVATVLEVAQHGVSIDDVTVLRPDGDETRWGLVTMRRLGPN